MPWTGVAMGAEVPHRVTTGVRPVRQLKTCNRTLADLIRECWEQRPEQRPDFGEIVLRTEAMLGIRPTPRAAGGEEVDDDVERAGGVGLSRPASPES